MLTRKELATLEGRELVLRFHDGHAVRAKLVSASADEPDDVIYRVIELLSVGPPELAAVTPGTVAACNFDDLASVVTPDSA